MHILAALLAVLGGAAFWWWRLKMIKEAGDEVTDAAGRLWGKYKRAKFRRKVEDSPLEAVDDPAAAAVIMMFAMAQEAGPLTPAMEEAIGKEVRHTMGIEDPVELLAFGKWTASHVVDAGNVSLRYAKLWRGNLNASELVDLQAMVERVAAASASGTPTPGQKAKLGKLRERLGLTA